MECDEAEPPSAGLADRPVSKLVCMQNRVGMSSRWIWRWPLHSKLQPCERQSLVPKLP